jgi:hypothetical protein
LGITVSITAPANPDSIQDKTPIPLRRAMPGLVLLELLLPLEGLAVFPDALELEREVVRYQISQI